MVDIGFGAFKGPDLSYVGAAGPVDADTVVTSDGGTLNIEGLAVDSQEVYSSPFAVGLVRINLSWYEPSAGSAMGTAGGVQSYLLSFASGGDYGPERLVYSTFTTMEGLAQGQTISVRVRARTASGAYGPYSTLSILTNTYHPPPPKPTAPTLTGLVSGVTGYWDGLWELDPITSTRPPTPADFGFVQLEVSLNASFDVVFRSNTTRTAANLIALGLSEGSFNIYGRLVAYSLAGIASPASAVAVIPSALINSGALAQDSVGAWALGPGAVETINVADFALTVMKMKTPTHYLL